ncbi:hypothetical protein [Dyadobacter sediminis]|uniref:Anti-sigma factor n=1 Tax=Dyadobacter sediminis TaxID=1493691 RepID=A0A5R9K825_9BACT|nr:hypothetical protein [Dyadobacter sediminis]TLU89962.1 hypothetical protein FEM55_20790 [Dyadobacter sediminis]GGC11349.1 hypothetical protein GCM10011325_42690 [Dyadobacter sediminis]
MKSSSDKKDRLERFVRDNRDGFDTFLPQDSLWGQIESKLHNEIPVVSEKSRKKIRRLNNPYFDWRIAAGVFLALGVGFLVYLNNEYGITRDPRVALKVPTYAREFNQYNNAIEQKREEIIKLARNNPEIYKDFSADLESLEVSYRNLRSSLSTAPNQEALLEAMVRNLQLQVDLLNQQLHILQRINKVKDDNDKENKNTPVI